MRIYMDICKFNPKNHYYFNDSLHFFKSYKTKSEPNRTFNTTPISIRNLLRQTTLYDFGYENRRYSKPSKVSCRNQIPTIPHINFETNPHPLHYQCCFASIWDSFLEKASVLPLFQYAATLSRGNGPNLFLQSWPF